MTQPFSDAASCLRGDLGGCADTDLFVLANPAYVAEQAATGVLGTGRVIYHECTTGQALGTITALILIAALTKRLLPAETPVAPEETLSGSGPASGILEVSWVYLAKGVPGGFG